ncbi:hypothetical protein EDD15DRAFT_2303803 [Pisolithus albus]|nr:hypothetical protein EDD15DRAFT_2303803 [Pisolithus albus]
MGLQWQCAQPLYLLLVFHDSVMAQDWSPGGNVAGLGGRDHRFVWRGGCHRQVIPAEHSQTSLILTGRLHHYTRLTVTNFRTLFISCKITDSLAFVNAH